MHKRLCHRAIEWTGREVSTPLLNYHSHSHWLIGYDTRFVIHLYEPNLLETFQKRDGSESRNETRSLKSTMNSRCMRLQTPPNTACSTGSRDSTKRIFLIWKCIVDQFSMSHDYQTLNRALQITERAYLQTQLTRNEIVCVGDFWI